MQRRFSGETDAYYSAARLIRNGLPLSSSIDDFLNIHNSNEAVVTFGKAAIISSIISAEKSSLLYIDPTNANNVMRVSAVTDTWLVKFMRILARGPALENVHSIFENITFIVFNYDRAIEHFLINALPPLYGISRDDAISIVSGINLIHPYGTVADLADVPYGAHPYNQADYFKLAKGIKTYTERIEEGDLLGKMRSAVHSAEQVVFLGFAYHDQNMQLLKSKKPLGLTRCFGTALHMSDSDRETVIDQLSSFLYAAARQQTQRHLVKINNALTSAQLFDFYAKSLEAA
ncbi:hypothetical protein [Tardiphaga sp. 285_C5_N1_2]|uniref:hypothetical protein n=1 Tax=Tardiphaga sp. 285_C5_N1_2 TaxID=3240775 RepID=UPI003F8CA5E0